MISAYWEIGILSIISTIIYSRKLYLNYKKKESVSYRLFEIFVIYFFVRIFPVLIMDNYDRSIFSFVFFDIASIICLYIVYKNNRKQKKLLSPMIVAYLINPFFSIVILSTHFYLKIIVIIMVITLSIATNYLYRQGDMIREFKWICTYISLEYLFISFFFLMIYLENKYYVEITVISKIIFGAMLFCIFLAGGLCFLFNCICPWNKKYVKENERETILFAINEKSFNSSLTKYDYIWSLIITIIMGSLIFYKIGATYAPSTEFVLSKNSENIQELIIDFGEEKDVSEAYIFLGRYDNIKLAFSRYDVDNCEWIVEYPEINVSSVYCWNKLEMSTSTQHLGIVPISDEAYINEIVFVDKEGNIIEPVNSKEYSSLFDEQEMFPNDLTYYYSTMFDEVYHARTANEILNKTSLYEYTHPQLGKILMSLGIKAFGMNPFGWRFICAIFGCMFTMLSYFVARHVSGKMWIAVLTSVFFSLDFMHYTLSRIGTIDIIIAFFLLAVFYSMYMSLSKLERDLLIINDENRKRIYKTEAIYLLISGVLLGLAIATKWTGIYAGVGLAISFLVYFLQHYTNLTDIKKDIKHLRYLLVICVISFICIPAIIYIMSFYPFIYSSYDKNLVSQAINVSMSMLSYHQGVEATHPFSSNWYEWLWIKRPLLDAVCYLKNTEGPLVSSVSTFGNPLVWLVGTIACIFNAYIWRVKKDRTAQYFIISFLSMIIPWMMVSRVLFIYHYFGCVLLMIPLTANAIRYISIISKKCNIAMMIISGMLTIGAGIIFVMFFSQISGYPAPVDYINDVLELIPSWVFA